jgi:multiple sugar transport system permease protein
MQQTDTEIRLRAPSSWGATALLWLSAAVVAFPFLWMLRSAFMPTKFIMRFPPLWIPPEVTFDNFTKLLTRQPFLHYISNSLMVATIVTVGQVVISALSAYAFARLRFPGRDKLFLLYLATMVIPVQVTLIPQYVLVSQLGWIDSYAALTVPMLSSAFLTFLLRQYFPGSSRMRRASTVPATSGSLRPSSCRCPARRWRPARCWPLSATGPITCGR